jgi:hypothetical protein
MKQSIDIDPAVAFFYEHAGFSYPADADQYRMVAGQLECARRLAEAERYGREHGWEVEWEYDPEPCLVCECGSEDCPCYTRITHVTLGAVLYVTPPDPYGLRVSTSTVASLWGICRPTREYQRVVAAELMREHLDALEADRAAEETGGLLAGSDLEWVMAHVHPWVQRDPWEGGGCG